MSNPVVLTLEIISLIETLRVQKESTDPKDKLLGLGSALLFSKKLRELGDSLKDDQAQLDKVLTYIETLVEKDLKI